MANVWDRATEFVSDNLGTVTPIALLLILVPISIRGNLTPLIETGNQATVLVIRIVGILLAILAIMGQLSIIALALDPNRTAGEAAAIARGRLLPVIIAVVLLLIGTCLLLAPMVALLMAAGIDPATMAAIGNGGAAPPLNIAPGYGWALMLYGLAAAIALLWIAARLVLIYPVIVAEPLGIGGLARSFRLTHGLALPIIGMLLLYGIVSTVASLAARTVFGSIFAIIGGGPGLSMVMTSVIVAAVATIFSVLSAAFIAKLYIALRDATGQAAIPV